MNFNIRFHPVGFGLFTSGEIGNFNFVYDCGSTRKNLIDKCVEAKFKTVANLNLLAISHFHRDHINGIKKLLESVSHIETIILPYLTPKEKLKHLISLESETEEVDSEVYFSDDWVKSFITDPSKTLLESFNDKISNIVFINGGPEEYKDKEGRIDELPENIAFDEFVFDIESLNHSRDETEIKSDEGIRSNKVSIREHGCVPLTSNKIQICKFIFYYCKQSKEVEDYFEKIKRDCKITSNEITKADLSSIIYDAKFSKIAKGYNVNNVDINNSSLLLYLSTGFNNHRGLIEYWGEVRLIHYSFNFNHYFDCHNHKNICNRGLFYTGDVNLKQKYTEIKKFYGKLIQSIAVFQVPHHGSIDNWDDTLSENNPRMLHIISSKISNHRGLHPNSAVLCQITKYQGVILWCNDDNEVIIQGGVWYR